MLNRLFTAPNFNLGNREDLNKILQSEIFLHKDGQLRAAHVILSLSNPRVLDQETTDIREAVVLQRRTPNLLASLESHVEGTTPEVAVNPHHPTLLPFWVSLAKPLEKKMKKDKKATNELSKEGEVQPFKDQELPKESKAAKG
nr:hypothetical protein CFP56_40902 [Quercus suber]